MRVQEGDISGEQGKKVSQLNDAVSDLLQVLLTPLMQRDTKQCLYSPTVPSHRQYGPKIVFVLLSVLHAC